MTDWSDWREHFAWKPVKLTNGEWAWLKKVQVRSWYYGCCAGAWSGAEYREPQ